MKKLSISLVAFAVALVAAPVAHADTTPGWYAAMGVGVTFPTDPTFHTPDGKLKGAEENTNVAFLPAAGYAFDNGLRLEVEYFRSQNNLLKLEGANANGHLTNNAIFLNAFYDFKTGSILTPYVGAGIGPNFVDINKEGRNGGYLDGSAVVAAYQGIVGVSAQLDSNWAVTADYRYVGSYDPKVSYSSGGEARTTNASQNFILGLRYSFGAPAVVAEEPVAQREVVVPAVKPAAPARPVVAEVQDSFMVFFDFDKSVLTPEAKKIIAAAVEKFKQGGFAKLVVTGHTDTVGTEAYNQKLSERRARAVTAELERLGIKAGNIKKSGVGEKGLLVPTTEGVREAQNRRAEIVLAK